MTRCGAKLPFADAVRLDLNCDLGEGEPVRRTRALMGQVTSVNVACGGHAGDLASMERCLTWGRVLGVRVGAHPGIQGAFGRGEVTLTSAELEVLLVQQVGALDRLARAQRVRLQHVKLHGSLYHAVERDGKLAECYLRTVSRWFGGLRVYALAGGTLVALAKRRGVEVWEEAFLDRAYRDDGSLVPRSEAGAVLTDRAVLRKRLERLRQGRGLESQAGRELPLRPRTLCVHGDTPDAVVLARLAARTLFGR